MKRKEEVCSARRNSMPASPSCEMRSSWRTRSNTTSRFAGFISVHHSLGGTLMQNGHFAEAEKGGAVVSTRGRACSPDSSDAQHDPSGLLRSRRATGDVLAGCPRPWRWSGPTPQPQARSPESYGTSRSWTSIRKIRNNENCLTSAVDQSLFSSAV